MTQEPAYSERRLEKTVAVLYEIAEAVSRTRNLTELYGVIHTSLRAILPADNFFIALHDGPENSLRFPYFCDQFNEVPGGDGGSEFISRVIRAGSPMVCAREDGADMAGARAPSAWVGVPLIIRGVVIGAMGMSDYSGNRVLGPECLGLLNSVSRHVALAIERKEAENKIGEQRQITEKILESSPVGIALVQNRVFKWVNTEMVRMFGYRTKQEFQDRSVKMVYGAEEDFEFAGRTIYQGLSSRGKVDYEMDLIRSDGSFFPVHVRLNASSEEDPMAWTIATFTDISERRAAEKETVERERLQGVLEMAGAVCHEINQPLQAIIGYSELLELEPDVARGGNSIRAIRNQATRLGKITATLANITRYKTVEYPGKHKIVDIWGAGPEGGGLRN